MLPDVAAGPDDQAGEPELRSGLSGGAERMRPITDWKETDSWSGWGVLCSNNSLFFSRNERKEVYWDLLMHVVLPSVQLLPPYQTHGAVIS